MCCLLSTSLQKGEGCWPDLLGNAVQEAEGTATGHTSTALSHEQPLSWQSTSLFCEGHEFLLPSYPALV